MTDSFAKDNVFRTCWVIIIALAIITTAFLVFSDRSAQGIEAYGFVFENNAYRRVSELGLEADKTDLSIKIKNAVSSNGEHFLRATISIYVAGSQAEQIIQQVGRGDDGSYRLKWTLYSGHKNYGPSVRSFECSTGINTVSCDYEGKIKIYPKQGHVVDYPLDNYVFKLPFLVEPEIAFDAVKILNQTRSRITDRTLNLDVVDDDLYKELQNEFSGSRFRSHPPKLLLTFNMKRGGALIVAYWTVFAYLMFFLILFVFKINTLEGLLSSVTGFFFSVWSLRQILDPKDEIPMDLLDTTVIVFAVLILLTIFTRFVFGHYTKKPLS